MHYAPSVPSYQYLLLQQDYSVVIHMTIWVSMYPVFSENELI